MTGKIHSSGYNIFFAAIAFLVALVCYSGIVLENDMTGRVIYGVTWTLVGIFWLGRYLRRTGKST